MLSANLAAIGLVILAMVFPLNDNDFIGTSRRKKEGRGGGRGENSAFFDAPANEM